MSPPQACQRWRERRHLFRRPDEQAHRGDYEVGPVEWREAKAFVEAHHYSGSLPAAVRRFGLYRHARLAGVAVFSRPCNDAVLTNVFSCSAAAALELGRFVLLDECPGNSETLFLGRCFSALRAEGWAGVVSFSDPVPRTTVAGDVVLPGHLGVVYQAFNGLYLGRGKARTLRLLPDGTVFSERAASKVRAAERGWGYAASVLATWGAPPLPPWAEAAQRSAWLRLWLGRLTRPLRHGGCHRYAWPLHKKTVVRLPSGSYPKERDPCPVRPFPSGPKPARLPDPEAGGRGPSRAETATSPHS